MKNHNQQSSSSQAQGNADYLSENPGTAAVTARRSRLAAAAVIAGVAFAAMPHVSAASSQTLAGFMLSKPGINYGNYFDLRSTRTSTSVPAISSTTFATMYAHGFKTVRIPVTWGYRYNSSTKTLNATFMSTIKTTVTNALNAGLIVILDTHHEEWFEYNWAGKSSTTNASSTFPTTKLALSTSASETSNAGTYLGLYSTSTASYADTAYNIYMDIFKDIVVTFKEYSSNLIIEGLNEPDNGTSTSSTDNAYFSNTEVNTLNQALFSIVSANQSTNSSNTRTFMLSCNDEDNQSSLSALTLPTYSGLSTSTIKQRLMATCHYYYPTGFTLSGSPSTWSGATSGTTDSSDLDTRIGYMKTAATSLGIPVIMGEFGISWDKGQSSTSVTNWYTQVAARAKAAGVPAVAWDDGGGFKIMSHSSNTFSTSGTAYNILTAIGGN